MASNILSRLLPSVSDGNLGRHASTRPGIPPSDASSSDADHLETAIDEENLGEHFQDQDLEQLLDDAAQSEIAAESTAFLPDDDTGAVTRSSSPKRGTRPKWMQNQPARPSNMDDDDEVPESLLLEPGAGPLKTTKQRTQRKSRGAPMGELPPPVPGSATRSTRAQWRTARTQQRILDDDDDDDDGGVGGAHMPLRGGTSPMLITDPKDKAMWRWANVQNLDQFLDEVYRYFEEKGIWSILLRKILNLVSVAFVVGFTTFLTMCVNWSRIRTSTKLGEIVVPQCTKQMHGAYNFFIWIFAVLWIYYFVQFLVDIPRLWEMHNFFHHLLGIADIDIQTVSWQTVVSKLMALRDANASTAENLTAENRRFVTSQSKQRIDAHDIANRLMRKENYLIALINKDYFDTTVPIPFLGNQQFWTRSIEWNIGLTVMDFVFDEEGHIRPEFLTSTNRQQLIDTLRRRFAIAGIINIFFAPVLFVYYCISYFFQYFAEYHRNPSELGSRTFTPLAEWKFREFNELWHLFLRRKNMAYPYATRYLEQFPKDKMAQLCRFASFIAGGLAAVLGLASLIAPEHVLSLEILPGQTVLFWLGILSAIYAGARAQIPEEDLVLDPEYTLANVIECTRYYPASWAGRLHTDEVRRAFGSLYKQKIVVFVEEALSMIFTPYVLLISLPRCADGLVDFFREFTMHVDGLGHVCSFAVFDFTRPGKNVGARPMDAAVGRLTEEHYKARDNKMMASYYGFMNHYGTHKGRAAAAAAGAGSKARKAAAGRLFPLPPAFPSMLATPAAAFDPALGLAHPTRNPQPSSLPPTAARHSVPAAARLPACLASPPPAATPLPRTNQHLHPAAAAAAPEDDSMLGDSWRTDRAADADGDAGGAAAAAAENAGVLGLLLGLQRAHAEGRGVGF